MRLILGTGRAVGVHELREELARAKDETAQLQQRAAEALRRDKSYEDKCKAADASFAAVSNKVAQLDRENARCVSQAKRALASAGEVARRMARAEAAQHEPQYFNLAANYLSATRAALQAQQEAFGAVSAAEASLEASLSSAIASAATEETTSTAAALSGMRKARVCSAAPAVRRARDTPPLVRLVRVQLRVHGWDRG